MENCLQRKGCSWTACWSACKHHMRGREGGISLAGGRAGEGWCGERRPQRLGGQEGLPDIQGHWKGWSGDSGLGPVLYLEESSGRSEVRRLEGQDGTSGREDTSVGIDPWWGQVEWSAESLGDTRQPWVGGLGGGEGRDHRPGRAVTHWSPWQGLWGQSPVLYFLPHLTAARWL